MATGVLATGVLVDVESVGLVGLWQVGVSGEWSSQTRSLGWLASVLASICLGRTQLVQARTPENRCLATAAGILFGFPVFSHEGSEGISFYPNVSWRAKPA